MTNVVRARGANVKMAFAFGDTYDTPPAADSYYRVPLVSSAIGAEQGLDADDTLGSGRAVEDPSDGNITNTGDIVVPVDVRNFGLWLKLQFGDPDTAAQDHADGSITFASQPAADSVITINGTAFTFKASGASGNQINLGVDLAATVTAIATALNASGVSGVALATYAPVGGTKITVTVDAAGLAGNTFTLAADANSHGTVSGATLTGGTVKHSFASDAEDLPFAFIEVQKNDISWFGMNRQVRGGMLSIAMSPKGKLNCTISAIAKGEDEDDTSAAGDMTFLDVIRFVQAKGEITRNGVVEGQIVGATVKHDNKLEAVEVIRSDSEIEDADAGSSYASGDITVRLSDANKDIPTGQSNAYSFTFGWTIPGTNYSLKFTVGRAFLPRVKNAITGPGGIQKVFQWQAAKPDDDDTPTMLVELVNDVANYDNP